MLGALVYLRLMSIRNWAVSRVRRLRQPKYLIGAIVGCAYFYYFFFRPMSGAAGPRAAGAPSVQAAEGRSRGHPPPPPQWVGFTAPGDAVPRGVVSFRPLLSAASRADSRHR